MTTFFAPSTGGFYSSDLHGDNVPQDAVEIDDALRLQLLAAQAQGQRIVAGAGGVPVAEDPPAPTHDQQVAALKRAVQAQLDSVAQAHGYDDIVSAASYAGISAVPAYQAEGAAMAAWRSNVWAAAFAALAGDPLPTQNALLGALPTYTPPA
ncbi:MAG: hypothetical protein ACTHK2_04510 [Dokdonella sp.]|uniref:hypothetical protein n=1 Tax=Dokdonella sp. TaxID=2291710 RepID=UPI003F7D3811